VKLIAAFNRHFAKAVIIFCLLVLSVCYVNGTTKKFDTSITAGFNFDARALSIAFSRMYFGLYEGYVGYIKVMDVLESTLTPNGHNGRLVEDFPNLSDRTKIEAAFAAVKEIFPLWLPKYEVLSPQFMTPHFEDLGMVDFYHAAFVIFGVHADSTYKMYFLLLAATLILFFREHYKRPLPMVLCALTIGIYPVFFFSDILTTYVTIPTVTSNRAISVLGFIPILHVLCFLLVNRQATLSRGQITRLALQGLLFVFIASIRKTTISQLVGLCLVTGYVAFTYLWPLRRNLFVLDHLRLLKKPMLAASAIFLLAYFGYKQIQAASLNPIYSTDCVKPHHGTWYSMVVGLGAHPAWMKTYALAGGGVGTDQNAWAPFEEHMKKIGFTIPMMLCLETRNLGRVGLQEIVLKDWLFRFLKKHPGYALELYFYFKPKHYVDMMVLRLSQVQWQFYVWFGLLTAALTAWMLNAAKQGIINRHKIVMVSATMLVASWIPTIVTYIVYGLEEMWILLICASLWSALAASWAIQKRIEPWLLKRAK
jgi:hypothetical protein